MTNDDQFLSICRCKKVALKLIKNIEKYRKGKPVLKDKLKRDFVFKII